MQAFAGCLRMGRDEAPDAPRLAAALVREGEPSSAELGPLAVAWTSRARARVGGTLCLIDGRPRVEALAAELELDPSTPVAELLAVGYRALGDAVVERLAGEFTVLVWDGERAEGVLARDRTGARPLFVAQRGGDLLFASEVRVLLAALPAVPPPDPTAMTYWLARTTVRDPRTLYVGIERVPPGHLIRLDVRGWLQRSYWRPRFAEPREAGPEEAAAEIRAQLDQAVEHSLVGAHSPAVMLSGGLDSAAVAASAASVGPRRSLVTYSCLFPDHAEIDEAAQIHAVRERLGLQGVEAHFHGGSALAAAAEFIREWALPSASPNLFVWLPLLRRAAADGVDVMLDGEGGDELFGCAQYLIADRLRAGRGMAAIRVARRLPGMGGRPPRRWVRRALVEYGLRAALPAALHEGLRRARGAGRAAPSWVSADTAVVHRAAHDPWAWKRVPGPRWWAELAHVLTAGSDSLGAADQLRREGRMAGVELRHPLRDPDLIELMLSLPPELGFDPRLDRPLARRALAGALPEATLEDPGKPTFDALLTRALTGPDDSRLRELIAQPHPDLARRVRGDMVAAIVDSPAHARPPGWSAGLWRLATLELWLRHLEDPRDGVAAFERCAPAEHTFSVVGVPSRQMRERA